MADLVLAGDELLEIANGCFRPAKNKKPARYLKTLEFIAAVSQAKSQIEKVKGGKKDRREEAEHRVTILFDHTRLQAAERLTTVAAQAQDFLVASSSGKVAADQNSELYKFAEEVASKMNTLVEGLFGAIDPMSIITLIMGIINAIRTCRGLTPIPLPI